MVKGDKHNANRSVYDLDNANLNNTNLRSEIGDTEPNRYCIYGEIEAEEN